MEISYDPTVNALYIRLIEGPVECEVMRLNERVAINIGPQEQLVGIILFITGALYFRRMEKIFADVA